jgi:hypothetical protein
MLNVTKSHRGMEVQLHAFLTSASDAVVSFTLRPLYLSDKGAPSPIGQEAENLPI